MIMTKDAPDTHMRSQGSRVIHSVEHKCLTSRCGSLRLERTAYRSIVVTVLDAVTCQRCLANLIRYTALW